MDVMSHSTTKAVVAACLAVLCAVGIASQRGKGPAAVDTKRIVNADQEPGNWMSVGRTYQEQRYSPLAQINENNVGQLGLAWYYDLNTQRGIEGTPVVVDGVMYGTSAWTITFALDAKTGRELWRYDPKVPAEWSRFVCCDVVSRGPAVYEGKVIIATLDGRLIALDAKNGRPLWETPTVDNKEWPYSITGAPRVFKGKVIIGNGGVELGVRGYVSAYDVNTGKLAWRFYTVPGDPAKGFENKTMEMAAKTWSGRYWAQGGGGAPWDAMVYDPDLNLVYFGTGNGAPWPHKLRSEGKGDNLFLASIVAVNADTGEYQWHYQLIPQESWDFDVTQPLMLADLKIEGKTRKVLMQAPKHGFFYVIDRTNGKVISAGKFVDHNNFASSIDLHTGRPVLLPDADYESKPRLLTPNAVAAHSWQPMSYSPKTGLVYFPVLENWLPYEVEENYKATKFRMSWGTNAPPSEKNAEVRALAAAKKIDGYLLAWDPIAQKEVWRVPYGMGGNGGTVTTAGNLVFEGNTQQQFVAYRATDGKKLWEAHAQTVPMAGPMTYSVDGEQYVAVQAGGATFGFAMGPPARSGGRVLAYKLGGTAQLPPLPPAKPIPPPPFAMGGTEEQVRAGQAAYHKTCAQCHGRDAVSINAIPDLRFMEPETRAQFKDIVLKGIRSAKGMQSFADVVSDADAEAINAYLIARAREDYQK
jgi:quinohemoprotein ethanol dehydrogenase